MSNTAFTDSAAMTLVTRYTHGDSIAGTRLNGNWHFYNIVDGVRIGLAERADDPVSTE